MVKFYQLGGEDGCSLLWACRHWWICNGYIVKRSVATLIWWDRYDI